MSWKPNTLLLDGAVSFHRRTFHASLGGGARPSFPKSFPSVVPQMPKFSIPTAWFSRPSCPNFTSFQNLGWQSPHQPLCPVRLWKSPASVWPITGLMASHSLLYIFPTFFIIMMTFNVLNPVWIPEINLSQSIRVRWSDGHLRLDRWLQGYSVRTGPKPTQHWRQVYFQSWQRRFCWEKMTGKYHKILKMF